MPRGPERKSGRGIGLPLAVGGVALGVGAYIFADDIVERLAGSPPPEPQLIEIVQREPISLAIGVDRTPSDIRHELPRVIEATRDFLLRSDLLASGDRVRICSFAEHATCGGFTLPEGQTPAATAVGMIETEHRKGIQTHVAQSIGEIVDAIDEEKNPIAVVWSDAVENGNPAAAGSAPLPVPVRIIVPRHGFLDDAQQVKANLPAGSDVETAVAATAEDFGQQLAIFIGGLTREAEARAAAENERRRAEYDAARAGYDATREAYISRVERWKRNIRRVLGGIVGVLGLLIAWGMYDRSRPRLRGFIVDRRGKGYQDVYPLPETTSDHEIGDMLEADRSIVLSPTKTGIVVNGYPLRNGGEIINGIFYYESEPPDAQRKP